MLKELWSLRMQMLKPKLLVQTLLYTVKPLLSGPPIKRTLSIEWTPILADADTINIPS